jgi:shikimate dehydrogenase
MKIDGNTRFIAHIGFPTHSFKAPLIYNPYFERYDINAVVVPFACEPAHLADLLAGLKHQNNFVGALITMPHKITVMDLLDEASEKALIAGACNALKVANGRLVGDMFDGEGFVRGLIVKGIPLHGARAIVVGAGGVGCAIAASLAAAGVEDFRVFDVDPQKMRSLGGRLQKHFPTVHVEYSGCPEGMDIVVNATPLGMKPDDPLPLDVSKISPRSTVGEVVMRVDKTPLVEHAEKIGCQVQIGLDMLYEQIPAYLDFFNLPITDAGTLRQVARVSE